MGPVARSCSILVRPAASSSPVIKRNEEKARSRYDPMSVSAYSWQTCVIASSTNPHSVNSAEIVSIVG